MRRRRAKKTRTTRRSREIKKTRRSQTLRRPHVPAKLTSKVLTKRSLVRRLEGATVMVLVSTRSGGSMGTGFFITRREIVTNRHVVEGALPGGVGVISHVLGKVRKVKVVRVSQGKNPRVDGDYAVLRLQKAAPVSPLVLTDSLNKLDTVVVAGFPGLIVQNDIHFQRLLAGDVTSVPDIALVSGDVSAIQNRRVNRVPLIVHTAPILSGNSGGPLVDACGRVVGVNTFVALKKREKANYTLSSTHLSRFIRPLKLTGVRRSRSRCVTNGM